MIKLEKNDSDSIFATPLPLKLIETEYKRMKLLTFMFPPELISKRELPWLKKVKDARIN